MADYTISHNQEQQVKKLKRFLEGWHMAVLPLKSIILWEQSWHPCAIVGSVSLIYFPIWLLDLNSLATFAVFGLFLNFLDLIVPVICNYFYERSSWTAEHENICKTMVTNYNKSLHSVRQFYALRETNPFKYYLLSFSLLITLAWVAASIDNTFLMYILSNTMLLMPGFANTGAYLALVNMRSKFIKAE